MVTLFSKTAILALVVASCSSTTTSAGGVSDPNQSFQQSRQVKASAQQQTQTAAARDASQYRQINSTAQQQPTNEQVAAAQPTSQQTAARQADQSRQDNAMAQQQTTNEQQVAAAAGEADEEPTSQQTAGEADEEPTSEQLAGEADEEEPTSEQTAGEVDEEEPTSEQTAGEADEEEPTSEQTAGEADEESTSEQLAGEADEEPTSEQMAGEADEELTSEQPAGEDDEEPASEQPVDDAADEVEPFMCVLAPVTFACSEVEDTSKGITLEDGVVKKCSISLSEDAAPDLAFVNINTTENIALSNVKFVFDKGEGQNKQIFLMRTDPGVPAARGTIKITWNHPDHPDCDQAEQVFAVTAPAPTMCTPSAVGDAHIRTTNGTALRFGGDGIFNLLYSGGFRVQSYLESCSAPTGACIRGVAIGYGESAVRFRFDEDDDQKVVIGKNADAVNSLSIERQKGNNLIHRVFITSEPSSYIDVNAKVFTNALGGSETYFDITTSLSQYLCKPVRGILKDPNQPKDRESVVDDSLFTCQDCTNNMEALTDADQISMKVVAALHNGYEVVDTDNLTTEPFQMG